MLDRDARAATFIAQTMRHWKADTDLIGVRDAEALAKLPEAERTSWRTLWVEVDGLLTRAASRWEARSKTGDLHRQDAKNSKKGKKDIILMIQS